MVVSTTDSSAKVNGDLTINCAIKHNMHDSHVIKAAHPLQQQTYYGVVGPKR
jgi:hypothetical protein